MSELEKVKIWIGLPISETDEDSLLNLLIETAGDVIDSLSSKPENYKSIQVEAVVYAYNQRGAEGNKSTNSGGGISQSWYYDTMSTFIKTNLPNRYIIK